jgi:hypothetical protein
MPLEYTKAIFAISWILAVCAVGFTAGATSVSGWSALAVIAVLPPVVMLLLWNDPPQSMSESIREARR